MHENGRRLVTNQYRDDGSGKEMLVSTADVEYYSFEQAGAYWAMANDSVTIQVRRSVGLSVCPSVCRTFARSVRIGWRRRRCGWFGWFVGWFADT